MSEQESLPPAEISRRIVTGMGMVYDLFVEMYTLFRLLHQGLEHSGAGIRPYGGKGYLLPRDRHTATPADRYIRTDMGLLAIVGPVGAEVVDEEEDEAPADELPEDEEEEQDKAVLSITPESRFLGVRAVLFDRAARDAAPVLVAAVLTDLRRFKKKQPDKTDTTFTVRRAHIKRLVKRLTSDVAENGTISSRITGFHLSGRVAALQRVELADIRHNADVTAFVERIVQSVKSSQG